jgi:hypothetical protein
MQVGIVEVCPSQRTTPTSSAVNYGLKGFGNPFESLIRHRPTRFLSLAPDGCDDQHKIVVNLFRYLRSNFYIGHCQPFFRKRSNSNSAICQRPLDCVPFSGVASLLSSCAPRSFCLNFPHRGAEKRFDNARASAFSAASTPT